MILSAKNIVKTFYDGKEEIQILQSLNLDVAAGECVAIMGPSGCGKTTLLQIISGLASPTSGSISINGYDLATLSQDQMAKLRNKHLGFVYQQSHLLPEFSVIENVALPQRIGGASKKKANEKAAVLLRRLGLGNRLELQVNRLSGGERQRVAIARAVVNEPQCVFADEPTGNLDEMHQGEVISLIEELRQQLKTAWVIVTHDHSVASKADRILKLSHGMLEV